MKEQIINSETAKLAKKKGFKVPGRYAYALSIPDRYIDVNSCYGEALDDVESGRYVEAPTQSLLQKWLREKHNLHITIMYLDCSLYFGYTIEDMSTNSFLTEEVYGTHVEPFDLYEKALEEALRESLKQI